MEAGRDAGSSPPASVLPATTMATEEETDILRIRTEGSPGLGGLSTWNQRIQQNGVDWQKPISASPFLCLS